MNCLTVSLSVRLEAKTKSVDLSFKSRVLKQYTEPFWIYRLYAAYIDCLCFICQILNVTRSVVRFINLISLMMLVAHWNGCMQYLVPVLDDFPDDSWVMLHGLRVSLYAICIFNTNFLIA